ncbi:VTT domain-containing protein [candidate division KSB1 bacterium]|nr:VTT domain-containing protein [candidate division KSB1 bacterium]
MGYHLKNLRFVHYFTHKYQEKGEVLFQKYGIGAVILGALTPVPFSVVCWLAGLFKMNYFKFALATFFRIPRLILYYYLIAVVWKNV